jgi:hypothetical protein
MSGRTRRLQICQLSLRESRCCFNHDGNGSQRMEACYLMLFGKLVPGVLYAAFRGHEQVSGELETCLSPFDASEMLRVVFMALFC